MTRLFHLYAVRRPTFHARQLKRYGELIYIWCKSVIMNYSCAVVRSCFIVACGLVMTTNPCLLSGLYGSRDDTLSHSDRQRRLLNGLCIRSPEDRIRGQTPLAARPHVLSTTRIIPELTHKPQQCRFVPVTFVSFPLRSPSDVFLSSPYVDAASNASTPSALCSSLKPTVLYASSLPHKDPQML